MFLRTLIIHKGISNAFAVRLISPAWYCTNAVVPAKKEEPLVDLLNPQSVEAHKEYLRGLLKEELPKPYDGPERDLVNFPRKPRPIETGKVRMGFLPEEWFQFFYKKTGVTGPYMFGAGLLTFLFSKEWYVVEHEFSTGVAMFILVYTAIKKIGPATKAYMLKLVDDEEKFYEDQRKDSMVDIQKQIDEAKKSVWYAEGQKILMNAKRENVHMQLETEYRRRLMHVYEEVKKRLDYQLDYYNTKRKLEQKHMVNWIVNNVVKSITPQQEKEALQKCIEDLKVLSARA